MTRNGFGQMMVTQLPGRRTAQKPQRVTGISSGASLMRWLVLGCCLLVPSNTQPLAQQAITRDKAVTGKGDGQPGASEDKLDAYLARLGLTHLRLVYLEDRFNRASGPERIALAQQLADGYAQQLFTVLDDADKYAELSSRVKRLLELVPQARTDSVEILLLQMDYQRAEALIGRWLTDPNASAARGEAQGILTRVAADLDRLYRRMDEQVHRYFEQAGAAAAEETVSETVQRTQVLAARAGYFAAWSWLYAGALAGSREEVRKARQLFRRLLDIGDGDVYRDLDGAALGIESAWRARSAIGLALSECMLGNEEAARTCMEWVAAAAPLPLREQSDYWLVQALTWARRWDALGAFAERQAAKLPTVATAGRVLFCTGLVHAAHFPMERPPQVVGEQLVRLGLRGLARMNQFQVLRGLVTTYQVSLERPDTFWLAWLHAQQLRATADSGGNREAYRAAAEAYQRALAMPDARDDPAGAAQCRHEWAWCLFQLGQWEAARQQYMLAAEALRAVGHADAARAAWMAIVSAQKIVPLGTRQYQDIRAAVEWLQREFPGDELTRRAEFALNKLQIDSLPLSERIAALRSVPPSDPNYPLAAIDLCTLLYNDWKAAGEEDKRLKATILRSTVNQLLEKAGHELSVAQRLRLRYMLIQLAAVEGSWQEVQAQLAAAQPELSHVEPAQQSDWHYYAILVARAQGQLDELVRHCQWFLEQGRGSPVEAASLTAAANALERSSVQEHRVMLYSVYQRLVALWGSDPQSWVTHRNAHSAAAKAAQLAWQLGYEEQAQQWYDLLLQAFPRERSYLRAMGLLAFGKRQWQRSLECWRALLAGTPAGTDLWYEAKYYQLRCLLETDRAMAAKVWHEFQILDPNGGPPAWREKFRLVQQQLR